MPSIRLFRFYFVLLLLSLGSLPTQAQLSARRRGQLAKEAAAVPRSLRSAAAPAPTAAVAPPMSRQDRQAYEQCPPPPRPGRKPRKARLRRIF